MRANGVPAGAPRIPQVLGLPESPTWPGALAGTDAAAAVRQAGALAALADQDWLSRVQARTLAARARLSAIATENGLRPLPSATNFVAIDCGRDGDFARRVLAELGALGVFVRMPGVAPLDRCIRISAGRPEQTDALLAALKQV